MDIKLGGVYSIQDEGLKKEMIMINSNGDRCSSLEEFIKKVFSFELKNRRDQRYTVCMMPASYDFDLSNENGSASPMDAARDYIGLIVEGFSVFVWDAHSKLIHYTEQNEYIYEPLTNVIDSTNPEPSKVTESDFVEAFRIRGFELISPKIYNQKTLAEIVGQIPAKMRPTVAALANTSSESLESALLDNGGLRWGNQNVHSDNKIDLQEFSAFFCEEMGKMTACQSDRTWLEKCAEAIRNGNIEHPIYETLKTSIQSSMRNR